VTAYSPSSAPHLSKLLRNWVGWFDRLQQDRIRDVMRSRAQPILALIPPASAPVAHFHQDASASDYTGHTLQSTISFLHVSETPQFQLCLTNSGLESPLQKPPLSPISVGLRLSR
jgi:hypothetical protein